MIIVGPHAPDPACAECRDLLAPDSRAMAATWHHGGYSTVTPRQPEPGRYVQLTRSRARHLMRWIRPGR